MAVELSLRLNAYRQAVANAIREGVPDFRDVKVHVGSFGVETLERFVQNPPAARISFLGMRSLKRNNVGQLIGPCTMAVFVFAKDPYPNQSYAPVLDLAEKTADFIDMNTFGLDYASACYVTDIEPIYSEALDKIGSGLVTVTFRQEVTIGRSRDLIDDAAMYPDFFDPDVLAAGWPANIRGNASSNVGVPNVMQDFEAQYAPPGDFTQNPPEDFVETGPHPDEDETL
jgi:hypothetical protein